MGNFRQLRVWQEGKKLAVDIYKLTNIKNFNNDYKFQSQIRSAAVSIPSNIAEGDELGTNKQSIKFFFIAKGSAAELITQLEIAGEIGYISNEIQRDLITRCEHISHMLSRIIKARSQNQSTKKP